MKAITLQTLRTFCATAPEKARYQNPWSKDSYTYAADGSILVRVERLAGVGENADAPSTGVKGFLKEAFRRSNSWKPMPPLPKGTEMIEIRAGLFGVKYLRLIASLPGVEISADGKDAYAPLLFRFESGRGILMPCDPKANEAKGEGK